MSEVIAQVLIRVITIQWMHGKSRIFEHYLPLMVYLRTESNLCIN